MNCFEGRQEFPALWRKTLAAARRAELLAHLHGCAKCDHALRAFALSAPVLHSESAPPAARAAGAERRDFNFEDRPRRILAPARNEPRTPRWMAMAAAVAVFVLSGSAAYLSARAPSASLSDELSNADAGASNSDAGADLFGPDQPIKANDFAS